MPDIIAPVFQLDRISPALEAMLGRTMLKIARDKAKAREKPSGGRNAILTDNITRGGLQFLNILIEHGTLSTKEIAARRGIAAGSQSHLCVRYYEQGMIDRERISPIRGNPFYEYTITAKGMEAATRAQAALDGQDAA